MATFYETVTAAVADIAEHGYDSQSRVDMWIDRIRKSAVESMVSPQLLERTLNDTMRGIYERMVGQGQIAKLHPGVARYVLDRVKPKLRNELDRRIMASANLIKLNRQATIEKTIQRFAGWSTSIPVGGSEVVQRSAVKSDIRKALVQLPYEERRCLTDQGHKLVAALNDIVAVDGGAIAAIWRHHHSQYPRKPHVEREGTVFLIRGSWAQEKGFVKPGAAGYTDQIEQPAEFVYCRCSYQYVYAIRELPADMITEKGRAELDRVRAEIRARMAA